MEHENNWENLFKSLQLTEFRKKAQFHVATSISFCTFFAQIAKWMVLL